MAEIDLSEILKRVTKITIDSRPPTNDSTIEFVYAKDQLILFFNSIGKNMVYETQTAEDVTFAIISKT